MRTIPSKLKYAVAIALAGMASSSYAALDLTGASYVTYGDANSYALAVNQAMTGDKNWYVNSTPGAIQDLVVVATGSSGGPVTTNFAGMDDAMSTPSGVNGSTFFSGVWNSTLAAFTNFLDGENALFFFNNNQVNSGAATNQNLAVWAQISLTGDGLAPVYFDFTNQGLMFAPFNLGGGGTLNGDPSLYNSVGAGPLAGTNLATDYVLSGGEICLNAAKAPVPCGDPSAVETVNNNLGANQAAYAIDVPDLNTWLSAWLNGEHAGYTDFNLNLRFGCDPSTVNPEINCTARSANNGYEQLFIGTSTTVVQVPEPGSLALLGLGLLGLVAGLRRKAATAG